MLKPSDDRWGVRALLALIVIGAIDRTYLLFVFGFRYIGIDDALIQQVAVDYGNGIFREPFLYGQNYNPMLEALLAAPFVRFGAAPWIALPIVTSILALIPFWSFAWWCRKHEWISAALVFASMPIVLPVEWGMMTTMSRGFVHGIAWLALLPWLQEWKHPLFKHASTALVLATAMFCNPNALPLVAGIGIWLIAQHFRTVVFWCMNLVALGTFIAIHFRTQAFFDDHPIVHPLGANDLHFSPQLFWYGLRHPDDHLLHVNPFGGWAIIVLLGLVVDGYVLWRSHQRAMALSLVAGLLVMVLALGIVKVHAGCHSVFFPLSRMFLSFPVMVAMVTAFHLRSAPLSKKWILLVLLVVPTGLVADKMSRTEAVIDREIAQQSCAFVREELISETRERCERIKAAALAEQVELIVPIRWPGIRVDHQQHFSAHFGCYACEQLVAGFPPVYGAGYDRRSWLHARYESAPVGRVLFVGGDQDAWTRAMDRGRKISNASTDRIAMHAATCDTIAVGDLILELGVDDDLGR